MKFASTSRSKIQSIKCCILYDAKDGTIKHVHRTITIAGANESYECSIEERTLELARDLGVDITSTRALRLDDEELDPNKQYKVDVDRCSLVVLDEKEYPAR
jgi:hypothetical protein